jgi:predicted dehydrogenase
MAGSRALPRAKTPDPRSGPALRWGLVGTGFIAERFVRSLQRYTSAHVVGSRTAGSATKFAAALGLPGSHGSYTELVGDPEVDVVYVATPHPMHHPCAPLALREITGEAYRLGLFCMAATWTFFLPKCDVIRQLLDDGVLGEVRTVLADHGEHFDLDQRIMRPELAGGAMLDLGTYPAALVTPPWVRMPRSSRLGNRRPLGSTGQLSAVISDVDGNQARVHCTIFKNAPTAAVIAGSAATLTLPGAYYVPGPFNLRVCVAGAERPGRHPADHGRHPAPDRRALRGRVAVASMPSFGREPAREKEGRCRSRRC